MLARWPRPNRDQAPSQDVGRNQRPHPLKPLLWTGTRRCLPSGHRGHAKTVMSRLKTHVFPLIGARAIVDLDTHDLMQTPGSDQEARHDGRGFKGTKLPAQHHARGKTCSADHHKPCLRSRRLDQSPADSPSPRPTLIAPARTAGAYRHLQRPRTDPADGPAVAACVRPLQRTALRPLERVRPQARHLGNTRTLDPRWKEYPFPQGVRRWPATSNWYPYRRKPIDPTGADPRTSLANSTWC